MGKGVVDLQAVPEEIVCVCAMDLVRALSVEQVAAVGSVCVMDPARALLVVLVLVAGSVCVMAHVVQAPLAVPVVPPKVEACVMDPVW